MNKHRKRACALFLAGAILIGAALGIHIVQRNQDRMAAQTAQLLLQQLELSRVPVIGTQEQPEGVSDPLLPQRQYMDYQLIGSLSIPSVGIHLPILDNWDEAMLKVAPCRYEGSLSEKNLILMGHNYRSHFTPLRKVKAGALVEFTNTDGKVFHFKVELTEILHRNEGEKLVSEYPLTIFTCTPGGINRFVVRCVPADK